LSRDQNSRAASARGDGVALHPALLGVRAVLFDVGGTLTHPDWSRLAQLASREAGREFAPAELERAFKDGLKGVDACIRRGEAPPVDTTRRHWTFRRMYGGLGVGEEACERVCALLDESHNERHLWCGVDPEAPRVLAALKGAGLRTAVISNTEDGRLEELMALIELDRHFDFLIDSFVVGERKPDAAIFLRALARLGVEPREAAFVGDSYTHDALAALTVGMSAILLDPLDLHPEAVCPRVRALGELTGAEPDPRPRIDAATNRSE
jgi:putative hydrolase of the HAD superfamily